MTSCRALFEGNRIKPVVSTEQFIKQHDHVTKLIIIEMDKQRSISGEERSQYLKSVSHLTQPDGVLHSVLIVLEHFTRIERRVNVDALHFASEFGFECLEGEQVIAENQPVVELIVLGNASGGDV